MADCLVCRAVQAILETLRAGYFCPHCNQVITIYPDGTITRHRPTRAPAPIRKTDVSGHVIDGE